MKCACSLSESDIIGCREDCINRQLFIECSSKCPCGSNCVNQNFQRCNYAKTTVYQTKDKGAGLRAEESIMKGDFIVEYVGEVIDKQQFGKRKAELKDHLYFMALNSTTFIDAKFKGNESRFINHSCDPNCQIQKWTVNGELRIGIFASKDLRFGEEITCNYHGK